MISAPSLSTPSGQFVNLEGRSHQFHSMVENAWCIRVVDSVSHFSYYLLYFVV